MWAGGTLRWVGGVQGPAGRGAIQILPHHPPTSTHATPPLLQREGLGGLYKGLAPNVLRVMPQSALTFLVYESVLRALTPK